MPLRRVGVGALRQVVGGASDDIGISDEGGLLGVLTAVNGVAGLGELTAEHGQGAGRYVAGNPLASVALGSHGDVGAASETVQHHVAGVGAGEDDALGEGDGLLRRVAGALGGRRWVYVYPPLWAWRVASITAARAG